MSLGVILATPPLLPDEIATPFVVAEHPQSRHRISLAALLAAWGLLALWLAWTRVTLDVIDDIHRYERAQELAKSQPLNRR